MTLDDIYSYLKNTGWQELSETKNHFSRNGTVGFVAVDTSTNEAFIVESIGAVPWSRFSSIENFEQDLAHLQEPE